MSTPVVSRCSPRGIDVPDGANGPSSQAVLSRAAGENFPVALRILPRRHRDDLLAIYGYARLTDELGDGYDGDRRVALDQLASLVDAAFGNPPPAEGPAGGAPAAWGQLVNRAAGMVQSHGGDPTPLYDLIAANRQDQEVRDYATFDQLVAYCRLSANPVGHLVLAAFDAGNPQRRAWSDRICTGLQLAEHWQDVAEDARAGRVYLPGEDRARFAVTPEMLGESSVSPQLRGLMIFEAARARRLLESGAPLVADLRGWARLAIAGFVAGGFAALDAVASVDFDVLAHPSPRPAKPRLARHALRLLSSRSVGAAGGAEP